MQERPLKLHTVKFRPFLNSDYIFELSFMAPDQQAAEEQARDLLMSSSFPMWFDSMLPCDCELARPN